MRSHTRFYTPVLLLLFALTPVCSAQDIRMPRPREEELLNGLEVLIYKTRGSAQVDLKLRIHNGAAFDPKGKEGAMRMLAENFFPDKGVESLFADELGGSLSVVTGYDYIQINATARTGDFLTALETLAPAVTQTNIDKTTTAAIKARRLSRIAGLESDPVYLADEAAARRLFGSFPYGRTTEGTRTSLNRIDFADLIFADRRYLTADNATLAITGNVDPDFAYRAARRLFGGWVMSGNTIPATFKIPDSPPSEPKVVYFEGPPSVRTVFAVEAASRRDPGYYATRALELIAAQRLAALGDDTAGLKARIAYDAYLLKGRLLFSVSKTADGEINDAFREAVLKNSADLFREILKTRITKPEFDAAKAKLVDRLRKMDPAGFRLDLETYKLGSSREEISRLGRLTVADVTREAGKIVKNPSARVLFITRPAAKIESSDPKDPS